MKLIALFVTFCLVSICSIVFQEKDTPDDADLKFDSKMLLLEKSGNSDPDLLAKMASEADMLLSDKPDSKIGQGWKATALVLQSSKLFQKGDWQNGLKKWNGGLKILAELDNEEATAAVKLRIASIYLNSWMYEQSPERKEELRARGIVNYENLQGTEYWDALPDPVKTALKAKFDFANSKETKAPETKKKAKATSGTATSDRFDFEVREDFFEGIFNEDEEAFARAMTKCEQALAKNPNNWEALVWLGSGFVYRSGQTQEAGNEELATNELTEGLAMMHQACAMAPDDVSVLIPRAATLVQIGRTVPLSKSERLAILNLAVYDYEKTYELQQAYFDSLSSHAKGELLFGLGDGWHQLNNKTKSKGYFEQVVSLSPESEQAKLAKMFLTGKIDKSVLANRNCAGCH
ncbi:MAG: hypothetical protein AAF939_14395 [Planctomycetota bacterium]